MYNGHSLNARNFFAASAHSASITTSPPLWVVPSSATNSSSSPPTKASRESVKTTLLQSNPLPAWKQGNFAGQRTINRPDYRTALPRQRDSVKP